MKEVKNRPLQKLNDTLPEVQNKKQPTWRNKNSENTADGGGRGQGRGQVGVGLVGDRGVFGWGRDAGFCFFSSPDMKCGSVDSPSF